MNNYVIYGAGGHAKVVADAIFSTGDNVYTFVYKQQSGYLLNIELNKSLENIVNPKSIIAIGDNNVRMRVSSESKFPFGIVIHPSSVISKTSKILDGSMILHSSIVQTHCKIGLHVIVNTKASIDHDCIIEDFVHIAPGAILCGNVQVGKGSLIGAGAVVLPKIKIGKFCLVGAGSIVTKNVPDYSVVAGNPARIFRQMK